MAQKEKDMEYERIRQQNESNRLEEAKLTYQLSVIDQKLQESIQELANCYGEDMEKRQLCLDLLVCLQNTFSDNLENQIENMSDFVEIFCKLSDVNTLTRQEIEQSVRVCLEAGMSRAQLVGIVMGC